MSKQHHNLKIYPQYFIAIEKGDKTFEVRKKNRDYHVNDVLHLQEWTESQEYSGRSLDVEISYILDDEKYCKEGYVILGIKKFSLPSTIQNYS